jgi:hypothetical protein
MQPSIGRVVHYQRHGSPNGQHKSEPSPAIITNVREGLDRTIVSLVVFNPTGMYFNEDVVFDTAGGPGTWRWPPRV